jgi:hypothetical protein
MMLMRLSATPPPAAICRGLVGHTDEWRRRP